MITTTFSAALASPVPEQAVATAPATGEGKPFAEFLAEESASSPDKIPCPLESLPLDAPSFYAAGMQALQRFEQLLRERLDEAGIEPEPPLSFASGSDGHLYLTSTHPQADEISKILEEDRRLAHYFNKAASNLAIQRAAEEHVRFTAVYAENPDLAVQMFSHLFDDRPPPSLTVQISARSMESYFV